MLELVLKVLISSASVFIYGIGMGFTVSLLEQEINHYYESQHGIRFKDKITKQTIIILCFFFWYIILPSILGLKLGAIVLKSARETFFTQE